MSVAKLQRAIEAYAARELGGASVLLRHVATTPWASATFQGERHEFALEIEGVASARAVDFARSLRDLEIGLPGALVADLALTGARTAGTVTIAQIEALTVAD
jgi:hypothetical protein